MEDHVRIFDTTLRDGEQSPGCTMTREEKLKMAHQLKKLGVDIIEAGFPAASPGDWEAVNQIAREVGTPDGPVIAGLARANKGDIDAAWTAIQPAAKKRIHTFLSTSDIHIEYQFRSTREEMLQRAREMVRYARSLCDDVEFSPMDASRSDPEYMHQVLAAAIEEGATTLNIPDTVGYATPEEYGAMIRAIIEKVPGARDVIISTHCHDDLGMAVANSLAGVLNGARQVECTVNGIGERAGNASLEEVVMALNTRPQVYGVQSRVVTQELVPTSRLLVSCINVQVPPNKAIVGGNAFAHESGIHQDGILKNKLTYEIMNAETVGLDSNALVLGKHSGRHAFRKKLEAMGYTLDEEQLEHVFRSFKELADKKKVVEEPDIEALVAGEVARPAPVYTLDYVHATSGTHAIPTSTVRLRGPDDMMHIESAQGTGPVDATFKAINQIVGKPGTLIEFAVKAVTAGIDAVAEVMVRVQEPANADGSQQRIFNGYGVNSDTVVAAAEAYVAALNKLLADRQELLRSRAAHIGEEPAVTAPKTVAHL